jgi:hypothetical protein
MARWSIEDGEARTAPESRSAAAVRLHQPLPWRWQGEMLPLAGLTAIAALLTWIRVFQDPRYFKGDLLTQFLPYYGMLGERLRSFDLPGWNPTLFSGMPLAGDPISGWGYLPVMALFPFFSPVTAYKLHVGFHLLAAAWATFCLGRVLGLDRLGSFAAGAVFVLGPQFAFAQCCTARMQVTPWIPAAMAGIVLAVPSRSLAARLGWWGLVGLCFAQMIAGYFGKGFYYGILLCGAFLAYQVMFASPPARAFPARLWSLAVHSGATLLLAFLLSAVALLPRLDFLDDSNLQGGTYEAVGEGAARSPAWPLERTLRNVLTPDHSTYFIGLAVAALAVAGVVLAGRRLAAPFFAAASFIVLVLTLDTTPVHQLLYVIPKFKAIHEHQPQRILTVFNLGPAMLAGSAVSLIRTERISPRRLFFAAAAIVAGLILAMAVVRRGDYPFTDRMALVVTLTALVLVGLGVSRLFWSTDARRGPHSGAVAAVLLVLLLLGDLDRGFVWGKLDEGLQSPPIAALPASYTDASDLDGAGEFLREQMANGEMFRFYGYDAIYLKMPASGGGGRNYRLQWRNPAAEAILVNNRAITLDLQDIQGYNPVHFQDYVALYKMANNRAQEYHETDVLPTGLGSPLFDLLNARYVVIPSPYPFGRPDLLHLSIRYPTVFDNGTVRVLENPRALPRVWVVFSAQQATFDEALGLIDRGDIDPRATVLLETAPPTASENAEPGGGTARITHYEPDRIVAETQLAAPGYVVLSEPFDSGWTVTVDGREQEILRANGVLRAVALPAGSHIVRFHFHPRSLQLGLILTLSTIIVWFVAFAGTLFVSRRRPAALRIPSRLLGLPGESPVAGSRLVVDTSS